MSALDKLLKQQKNGGKPVISGHIDDPKLPSIVNKQQRRQAEAAYFERAEQQRQQAERAARERAAAMLVQNTPIDPDRFTEKPFNYYSTTEQRVNAERILAADFLRTKRLEQEYNKLQPTQEQLSEESRLSQLMSTASPQTNEWAQQLEDLQRPRLDAQAARDRAAEMLQRSQNAHKLASFGLERDNPDFIENAKPGKKASIFEGNYAADWRINADLENQSGFDNTIADIRQIKKYDLVTGEERAMYNYARSQGKGQEFLTAIDSELNRREAEASMAQREKAATQNFGSGAAYSLLSVPENLIGGLQGAMYAGSYQLTGNVVDPNAPAFRKTQMASATRQGISNEIAQENEGAPFLQKTIPFLYQTGMSMLDFLASAPLGGTGAMTMLGSSAASQTMQDAFSRGATQEQAVTLGVLAGAAEAVFERVSLGNLVSMPRAMRGEMLQTAIKNFFQQAGVEASEEIFTEIANTLSGSMVMGDLSQYNLSVAAYMQQGVPQQEAEQRASVDIFKNVVVAGLGGALSGGVMGGVGTVFSGYEGGNAPQANETLMKAAEEKAAKQIAQERTQTPSDAQIQAQRQSPSVAAISQNEAVATASKQAQLAGVAQRPSVDNEQLQVFASEYDSDVADTFVQNYAGSGIEGYARGFKSMYESGRNSLSYEQAIQSMYAQEFLSPEAQQAAYAAGTQVRQATAPVESVIETPVEDIPTIKKPSVETFGLTRNDTIKKLDRTQRAQLDVLDVMAKKYGLNIATVDRLDRADDLGNIIKSAANGMYDPKTRKITISMDAMDGALLFTGVHEMTHHIQEQNADEYSVLEAFVLEKLRSSDLYGDTTLGDRISALQANGYDRQGALDEIVADALPTFLADENIVRELVNENSTLAQRIKKFLQDFIAEMRRILNSISERGRAEITALQNDLDAMQTMYTLFDVMMQDANVQQEIDNIPEVADEERLSISTNRDLQAVSSAKTSINASKLPALFSKVTFKKGTVNLDIGGGKFDNVTDYLREQGVTNYIYDPYNRSEEHNAAAAAATEEGQADTVTISNVLNVIAEKEARIEVLKNAADALKPDGRVYITVYEGNETGISGKTSSGFQLNLKTAEYVDEVREVFGDVFLKNKVIVAQDAKDQTVKYSIKEGMAEQVRFDELNDAVVNVTIYDSSTSKLTQSDVDKLEQSTRRDARKYVRQLYDKFGVAGRYKSDSLDIEFDFSGKSFDKSLHEQTKRTASFSDLGKMLASFDDIVKNSIPVEIHQDKYADTRKADTDLERVYVLVSAYQDGGVVPVQFEIKEFVNKNNQLYVAATLNKIEAEVLAPENAHERLPAGARSTSNISLRNLFANINPEDGEFLKYVPDGFLDAAQMEAKQTAVRKEQQKIGRLRFSMKDSGGNNLTPEQAEFFKDSKARDENGVLQVVYHGTVSEFYEFSREFSNVESDMGKGFYFTNNSDDVSENYANEEGQDLVAKIEHLAERMENEEEYEDMDYDERLEIARKRLIKAEPRIIEAYLNMKNPVVLGGKDGTVFSYEENYDEELDEYDEPTGELVDFVDALESVLPDFYSDFQPASIYEQYDDDVLVSDLIDWLKETHLSYAEDSETGDLASSEIIRAAFEYMGYDGIIDYTVSKKWGSQSKRAKLMVGVGENTTHYIVFQSNQAKEVTNKAPTDSPDIRFSIKDISPADTEAVLQENVGLREATETLISEFQRVPVAEITDAQINRISREILKRASSGYDVRALSESLRTMFDYLSNTPEPVWDDVAAMGTGLAKDVLKESRSMDTEVSERYAPLRKALREDGISLSEPQKQEAAALFDSYLNFRRKLFGRLKVSDSSMSLDAQWQAWSEQFPELFDPEINEGDQVPTLVHILSTIQPRYDNPYGYDLDGAAYDLFLQMFESYYNVQGKKADAVTSAIVKARTQAKATYNRRLLKQRQQQMERRKSLAAKFNKAKEDQALLASMVAGRTKMEGQKAQAKALQEQAEKYRAQYLKLSERSNEKLLAQKALFQEKTRADTAKRKERVEINKYRKRIKDNASDLLTWLNRPTKEKHVPEFMRDVVISVLQNIDFEGRKESRASRTWNAAIEKLADELKNYAMANSTDPAVVGSVKNAAKYQQFYMALPAEFTGMLDLYAGSLAERGMTKISDLDAAQLREFDYILSIVRNAMMSINKMWSNTRYKEVSAAGREAIQYADTVKQKKAYKAGSWADSINRLLNANMLDSYSWGDEMGAAGQSIVSSLSQGMEKAYTRIREAKEFMEGLRKELGVRETEISNWGKTTHAFTLTSGNVTISPTGIMELYALSRRAQGLKHILAGGIQVRDIDTGKGIVHQPKSYMLAASELTQILTTLTPEQKAFSERMQTFLSTEAAAWGNETSMQMWLYEMYKDEFYWPIASARSVIATQDPSQPRAFNAIANSSFTKPTSFYASNPIMIGDAFDTFTNHTAQMASYNGLTAPISDALAWYNYVQRDSEGRPMYNSTVKLAVERATGSAGQSYFINLIKDINGLSEGATGTEITNKLVSNMKRAAVAAKLRVVIQQPTAILRASAIIGPKYLAAATFKKRNIQEMRDNAPIAWWKAQGNYDIGIGRSMRGIIVGGDTWYKQAVNAAMTPAGAADDIAWAHLWEAVKLETAARHKETDAGSPEFLKIASERFSDIVNRTQVVDSVMHRSQIMRSKDSGVAQATAFMSEPIKTYNLLRNAARELANNPTDEAKKRMARTAVSVLASMAANAAVLAVHDAFRDRDPEKEEEFADTLLKKFWGHLADNVNPLSLIPYGSDILSLLSGYDVERMDMSAISDMLTSSKSILDAIQKGYSKRSVYALIASFAKSVSSVTGLPVGGLLSTAETVINTISPGAIDYKSKTATVDRTFNELYTAMAEKDNATATDLKKKLMDGSLGFNAKDQSDIDRGVRDAMMNADPRIAKAAKAFKSGDLSTYENVVHEITREGFKQDIPVSAVTNYITKYIDGKQEAPSSEFSAPLYKTADYVDAFERNDPEDMERVKKYLLELGKEKEDIRTAMTKAYKPVYLEYIHSGNTKAAGELANRLYKLDLGYDAGDLKKWVSQENKQ